MYMAINEDKELKPLIDAGFKSPTGIAVDQARQKLYVADPESEKIFRYGLHFKDGTLTADAKGETVATDVKATGVAVDGVGDVYFTDPGSNAIKRVKDPTEIAEAEANQGDKDPLVLYSGDTIAQVTQPAGIAADNFHLYWTNTVTGTASGSVVKGNEIPPDSNVALTVKQLTKNVDASHGVCLSARAVFYSDEGNGEKGSVYGVAKGGGEPTLISDKLQGPRGCVWDGAGTVFVADAVGNEIVSFPATGTPEKLGLTKVASFDDVTGLTMISKGARFSVSFAVLLGFLATALQAFS